MSNVNDLLNGVQENAPLAPYTSFKIGGTAEYFYAAKTALEIKQAAQVAKKLKLAYYIIGNGSNILVSDRGFDGLAIKVQSSKFKVQSSNSKFNIICDSGITLGKLVNEAIKNGLTGVEWMIGIPGTLGGAIYGNAGAFGHSIGEKIEKVEVLDPDDLTVKWINKEECGFGYRTSVFQPKDDQLRADKKNKYIILSAVLKLEKGDSAEIRNLIKEYIKKRGHYLKGFFSAGSVFKNVVISENQKAFDVLRKKFPEMDKFKTSGKIPAGWLIEELGLRGKKIGGAMIANEHGNFILNLGNAKATDVIMLISLIKQKVRVNFGLQLREEIQYVGF